MPIDPFSDLPVYPAAAGVAAAIFIISKRRLLEERYSPPNRIRRAPRPEGADIAEFRGERRYQAHFIGKPTDAHTENHEWKHGLLTAARDEYNTRDEKEKLIDQRKTVGKMLGSMIQKPKPFLLG